MKKIIIAYLTIALCFLMEVARAQETQPAAPKATVQLSESQWKALEGVFQLTGNKEMNVRFTPGEGVLLAKLLWNNNELHFLPESDLAFISKEAEEEGPLHIVFTRDSSGQVNQVRLANNNQVLNRVKDYKPVEKKEMVHTPEQLKPFEGLYRLQADNSRLIQLYVKANYLVLKQYWDGNEIVMFVPESELVFYSKIVPMFSLEFTKEKDGTISRFLDFKRDVWERAGKPALTLAQLKACEGKYQSKDDADNLIRITVKENNLVVKQLWDGKETIVSPMTDTYFYNAAQSYPVVVMKDKDGAVKQVTVLGTNVFNKVAE
jgi:hypothetical protein